MGDLENTGTIPPDLNPASKPAAKTAQKPAPKPVAKKIKPLTGHDPKNRHVYLKQTGEKFEVTKPATGFSFSGSEKQAKEVYNQQLSCSHN